MCVFDVKDNAVSPVIGTILLVALTVVLIGVIGAVLIGFSMAEPAPILGISIGQEGNITTLTHLNGEVLPAGSYKILVDGVDETANFSATGAFSPGMTLTWDSETEAVGTVSLVYTSDKGISTLLAEKTIGKAGRVGGSGEDDEGETEDENEDDTGDDDTGDDDTGDDDTGGETGGDSFEDIYTFNKKVDWQVFLNEVKDSKKNGKSLDYGTVYVDDGEYWVSYGNQEMKKKDANGDPSIGTYADSHSNSGLLKIDLSNEIFTSADIKPKNQWKEGVVITRGSFFEDDSGKLYICLQTGSQPPQPNSKYWLKFAKRKT